MILQIPCLMGIFVPSGKIIHLGLILIGNWNKFMYIWSMQRYKIINQEVLGWRMGAEKQGACIKGLLFWIRCNIPYGKLCYFPTNTIGCDGCTATVLPYFTFQTSLTIDKRIVCRQVLSLYSAWKLYHQHSPSSSYLYMESNHY